MKPRLLDLFCGAGGVTRGYQLAGFHVTGVDSEPQPRYVGDEFHQGDVLEFPPDEFHNFDVVHASPPCQRYMRSGAVNRDAHPDLLGRIRERLVGVAYVIENVPGAPMAPHVVLCGSMFNLSVRRHRWFESNLPLPPWTLMCDHSRRIAGVYGRPHGTAGAWPGMLPSDHTTWSQAMGIEWMTSDELAQAIPPAFTRYIGEQLMQQIRGAAA